MTPDPPNSPESVRNLVANASRALPANEPRAYVFFEERTDARATLASTGLRDVVTTRTRGGVIAGRRSVHLTDPDFMESGRGASGRDHGNWVAHVESALSDAGAAACAGRRHPFWSAKVVSFHQDVWVGSLHTDVVHDVRRGCRIELRAHVGGDGGAHAIEELVLHPEGTLPLREAFVRAFDRAETRASISYAPEPGSTSAVFAPGVAGIVAHELVGHAMEGDLVARRRSWIHGAALQAAARAVTVTDDPRRGRGAWMIDDEGVVARETVLIEKGRPVGMLLDRSSASALGKAPTGHGRRSSYLEAVLPRMGCTFIEPGSDDPEDVVRGTKTGVFIRRMVAGQADPISGRATFVVSDADRIVGGCLMEPLDVFVIEVDGVESWNSIDRVAGDLAFDTCVGSCVRDGQPLAVSVGAPTIRIGVVRVRS